MHRQIHFFIFYTERSNICKSLRQNLRRSDLLCGRQADDHRITPWFPLRGCGSTGRSDREFGKGVKQYLPGKINWQDCTPLRKTLDPSLSDPYLSHFTPLRKIYLERTNNTCSRKDRSSGFRCNCHRCFSS